MPVRCPLCGAAGAACGAAAGVGVTPIIFRRKGTPTMSALKPYDVHGSTFLLSDEDAKARGLLKDAPKTPAKKAAPQAANKARTASNK